MQIAEHYWNLGWKGTDEKNARHEKEPVWKTGPITLSKGKQDEYVDNFYSPEIENSVVLVFWSRPRFDDVPSFEYVRIRHRNQRFGVL